MSKVPKYKTSDNINFMQFVDTNDITIAKNTDKMSMDVPVRGTGITIKALLVFTFKAFLCLGER